MIVQYRLKKGEPLTPEEIAELEAAKSLPILFDEDSPALTPESYEGFRRSAALRSQRRKMEGKDAG